VPIAVNLYKIREAKDEAGDYFRAAQKQKNMYQGLWIVGVDGKLLATHGGFKTRETWSDEVLAAIEEGLAKAGKLTDRRPEPKDVLPFWGKGVADDGTVRLACQMRYFHQGKGIGQGALDEAVFSAKDFQAFSPLAARVGKTWNLPGTVSSEFSRCLSIVSDKSSMPKPDEVTEVDIVGSVERIRDGLATLRYTGHIAALHPHTFNKNYLYKAHARLRGTGIYDVQKQELVSLLWIFEGGNKTIRPPSQDESPIAAVVEWKK
jgi:hypothetical protein